MIIETKRLIIKPLSKQDMSNYILEDFSLESALALEHRPRAVNEHVREVIINKIIPKLTGNTNDDIYFTFWTIINKENNMMVGDACFKGRPNKNGEVELGYGTYPGFQRNGFMSEAIAEIANWAMEQDKVSAVIAETDPNNIASHKVLIKNDFIIEKQTKDSLYWRLDKV